MSEQKVWNELSRCGSDGVVLYSMWPVAGGGTIYPFGTPSCCMYVARDILPCGFRLGSRFCTPREMIAVGACTLYDVTTTTEWGPKHVKATPALSLGGVNGCATDKLGVGFVDTPLHIRSAGLP